MRSKKIKGFPNYRIYEDGRIYSIKRNLFLKAQVGHKKYLCCRIYKSGSGVSKRIHALVAECFLGKKPKNKEVNHIDGNKQNNHISNLEYVSSRVNHDHKQRVLYKKKRWGVTKFNTKHQGKFWAAFIFINGKQRYLGRSTTDPEPLYELYREKYKELHGKYPW